MYTNRHCAPSAPSPALIGASLEHDQGVIGHDGLRFGECQRVFDTTGCVLAEEHDGVSFGDCD